MRAKVGDKIVVSGHHVEVRGADGAPPYVVKWSDGHEGLYFPGSDASVVHHPRRHDG
jgi:hypothetical protein